MMKAKGTYTNLLANLLVYNDVDERSGYCHAVLAGHQILKGHLQQRLLDRGVALSNQFSPPVVDQQ